MSPRDLATTALCAPTGTSSTSAAASSSNPLAQLAEAVLPTTARPEHAASSNQHPSSSSVAPTSSQTTYDVASLIDVRPSSSEQHQQQQRQREPVLDHQLDAPQLPTNLFPSQFPPAPSVQHLQPVPVPIAPPPVPLPVTGDPTDVFESAFRHSAQSTKPTANHATAGNSTNHLVAPPTTRATTATAGPAPPPHMVHSFAQQPFVPYQHSARPPRQSSWRGMNSYFSGLSLNSNAMPQYSPNQNMMYHTPNPTQHAQSTPNPSAATATANQPNVHSQKQQPSNNIAETANIASSSTVTQQELGRGKTTNEQAEVSRMRGNQAYANEAIADALAWGEEFSTLQEMQQKESLEQETDGIEDLLFDETLQSAFQHWLRRDASDAYRFSTHNTTSTTLPSNQRSAAEALRQGIRAHNESRLSAAVYHLEDALNRPSSIAEESQSPVAKQALAWYVLGISLADLDDDERAIQALSQGLRTYDGSQVGNRREDNPYLWQSLIALSVSYTNELEHSRALRSMREWLDVRNSFQNGDGEAGIPQQHVLGGGKSGTNNSTNSDVFQRANHEELLESLNRVAVENPQDADAFIVLGILHNLNRDYASAAVALRHAVTIRPDVSNLWNKLGATLANGGKSDDALRAYRKAVDLQPALVRAWVNVGTAYSNRSEYSKAIRYYLKAITISKETAEKDALPNNGLGHSDGAGDMGHVWGYLRSSLISLSRPDLLHFVESRDMVSLRAHFNF